MFPPREDSSATNFATISDVAAHAGVSVATVSRVLSGKGPVAARTRELVEASIASLNYQPSMIARSLRSQRTNVIGLVVTDIENPFYPELVRGVEDAAQNLNYAVLLCNSSNNPEREQAYIDYLMSQRVDGVIVASGEFLNRNRERLLQMRTRLVAVDTERPEPGFVSICNDSHNGGRLVGEALHAAGYTHVYYLGPADMRESERFRGLVTALEGTPVTFIECSLSLDSATLATRELAAQAKGRYAIAGHNDLVAIGALRGLGELGIHVPSDAGVVGFDDIAMSSYVTPELTTVRQNQYDMGIEAMNAMEHLIDYRDVPESITIVSELVLRKSIAEPQRSSSSKGTA